MLWDLRAISTRRRIQTNVNNLNVLYNIYKRLEFNFIKILILLRVFLFIIFTKI